MISFQISNRRVKLAKYRAAVIGLGWMGMLYDLARRMGQWHIDDVDRPMPTEIDVSNTFHYHNRHLPRGLPTSYSEALADRPDVELVSAAERDKNRLAIFGERYGVKSLYTDAMEMLREERPDIVAISTNVKGRSDLTCMAVECGAKGIMTEKPIAYTLEEADLMVRTCAEAKVPLVCGAISTNHPSFAKAKELVNSGVIGELISIEAVSDKNLSQHQNWSYFLDSEPDWVIGIDDQPKRDSGSNEFRGQGMLVAIDKLVVFFRKGAPSIRITGTSGEISHPENYEEWELACDTDTIAGLKRVKMPWPDPQMTKDLTVTHGFADIFECLDGIIEEPKNSGRRVARALEVEIAIKMSSAQGGARVDLPLEDRSLGLEYDWHR